MNSATPTTVTPGAPLGTELAGGYPRAEALAALRPTIGELQVRMAAIGHGKSADAYVLVPALARQGVVLFAHTDGSTGSEVRALGLNAGGANVDVAQNVRITHVISAQRIAVLLYRAVSSAARSAAPLPVALVIDEVGDITWNDGSELSVLGTRRRTTELLRAVATLDLDRIGELVGLTFETWGGYRAPDLSGCGIAVVAYMRTRPALGSWGRTSVLRDDQSLLPDLPDAGLAAFASSIVALQRLNSAGDVATAAGLGSDGRFVILKARRAPSPQKVPMRFDATGGGYRPRWRDDV